MEPKNAMLEAALYYLRQGMSVFPVDFDGRVKGADKAKSPLIPSTDPYLTALPTEAEVTEWWTRWPWAAVAVATGKVSGITVIDSEAGADLSLFGLEGVETPSSASGGGGKHYWFAYDPDVGNKVRFAPLYDIRSDRGYIIAPPSDHASGGRYSWIVPFGSVPLAPFPKDVKDAIRKNTRSTREELDALLKDGAAKGERNESATVLAGSLLARYPQDQWVSVVWPILQMWNATKNRPPDDEGKLYATFESICRAELGKRNLKDAQKGAYRMEGEMVAGPDGITVIHRTEGAEIRLAFTDVSFGRARSLDAELTVSHTVKGLPPTEYGTRINMNSMSSRRDMAGELDRCFGKDFQWPLMLANAVPALKRYAIGRSKSVSVWELEPRGTRSENLLGPLLADKATNLLFGMGGGGKTYLCARIAISIATGTPFLDFTPSGKHGVMFLDYEDVGEEFRGRIDELASGMAVPPDFDDLARIRYRNAGGVPIHDLIPHLKAELAREGIGLLIVDSVGSACGSELEKAESATGYWNDLNSLGITTLSIAHVAKGGTENADGEANTKGQRSAFGSVFFHNGARNTWNLVAMEEDSDVLKTCLYHRKSNRGRKYGMLPLETDFSQLETKRCVTICKGRMSDWEGAMKPQERIMRFLKAGGRDRTAIIEAMDDVTEANMKKTLNRMVRSGKLLLAGGQGGVYSINEDIHTTVPPTRNR